MTANLAALSYLVAAVLFILALRGLSNPETSRQGNLFGMLGMAIAIGVTLTSHPPAGTGAWILVALGLVDAQREVERALPPIRDPVVVAVAGEGARSEDGKNGDRRGDGQGQSAEHGASMVAGVGICP